MPTVTPFVLSSALEFGIQSNSGTFIQKISNKASVETAELLNGSGEVGRAWPFKNMSKGTVKGHDTTAVVPGVGDSGVGSNSGLTIINDLTNEEENTTPTGWEYSYTVYPAGAAS